MAARTASESIHQQRAFAAPAGFLLAAAEQEITPKLEALRHLHQMLRADQVGAELGEPALTMVREAGKELPAGDEREHGVAEELELLVMADGVRLLAGKRDVGERLAQQPGPREVMPQRGFQSLNRDVLHSSTAARVASPERCAARGPYFGWAC